MFIHHLPYSTDLAHSNFHIFLHLKKFLFGQRLVSEWFQSQAADFYDTWFKSWPNGMTNISFPELNMFKNSSILAVCVTIHLSIKLGFVCINPRETSFVHRCGPGSSMRACYAAGPGSIPGRDKFPG